MGAFDTALGMVIPDKHKKRWKTAFDLLGKARNHEQLVDDLQRVDDPLVCRLHHHVQAMARRVESKPHRRNFLRAAELALWILSFDTAYRDQGIWLLKELIYDEEVVRLVHEAPHVPPEHWYVNAIQDPDLAEDLALSLEDADEVLE